MASLQTDRDELYANIALLLGIARDNANWDTSTTSDVNRIIRLGYQKLYSSHRWSFLEVEHRILTTAPFNNGTITVAAGVVTKTGATNWPTDITRYKLVVGSGTGAGIYDIASRTSNTVIVLADTSLNITTASTYNAYQWKFVLPTNFAGMLTPVSIENNEILQECYSFPNFTLRSVGDMNRVTADRPQMFAVTHEITSDEVPIPTYLLEVWPLPDKVYVLKFQYRIQPGDSSAQTETTDIFPAHLSGLLQECILAQAELMYNNERGVHYQAFQEMLPDYIKRDNAMRGTKRLLPRDTEYIRGLEYRLANVTWVEI